MENKNVGLFITNSRRTYERWNVGKLWGKWLSIYHQEDLHPSDKKELEVISDVLNKKLLPEKREFYSQLDGWGKRLYIENFLCI